jgi:recombination protein RecA
MMPGQSPETTTGGNALKFYSSVRLEIRRAGNLKEGDTVVGTRAKVKVVKNKVAPPFQECEFDLLYGTGISRPGEVLDLATAAGLIEKSGNHFLLNGERLGQGRDRSIEYLRERVGILEDLAAKVAAHGPAAAPPPPAEAAA